MINILNNINCTANVTPSLSKLDEQLCDQKINVCRM